MTKVRKQKARFQQGSIRRVSRADGYVWQVRFSEYTPEGKRHQRTVTYDGATHPTKTDVRKAIQFEVSQLNTGGAVVKSEAKFMDVTELYRTKHLPTLEHSTQVLHRYLLKNHIEARFGRTRVRDMKPLLIEEWFQSLTLSPTTQANIRTVMSGCFRLAAMHEYIPTSDKGIMTLIRLKGVTKRKKQIPKLTVEQFQAVFAELGEPLNIMVLVDAAFGLRISELLALKWEDINDQEKTIQIRRKFTRGKLGETKSVSSEAALPIAPALLQVLQQYRPKTNGSEWLFPSPRTGGPRSASMLLQKGLKPVAAKHGIPGLTWHVLRHACRAWLSSGGANLTTQKELLRHSDISTTGNVYGYAINDDMRRAHDQLVGQLLLSQS